MTPRSLAYRSVVQGRGRYFAYLGSAAFAVTIYFLYSALALHPSLEGGYRAAQYVRLSTSASASVIALFTFLFLLYSSAAFLRFRSKELGLLELMGMTRLQLARIVLWENVIVAAMALAAGLGVGLLFLHLFFMAISVVLDLPEELPFYAYAGAPVFARTVAVFAAFFLVATLISLRGVLRENIVGLLRARRKPNAHPAFSRMRALTGAVLIGAGYAWASFQEPMAVVAGVVPVTIMVSVGTFLAMREGSIALLNKVRRWERLFYRPRPFLLVSRFVFKVQENYRVLSAVSLVVAVIVSAVGTVYSVYGVAGPDAGFGLALFNGIFVSLVFFAAACSLLYFRLFTEIDEDRRYFRRLREVGVAGDELRKLAATQNAVLFLVPFAVGLVHSTFAMKALGTLLAAVSAPLWSGTIAIGWRVAAAYFVAYLGCFSATHALYRRSLGEDLSKSY